MHNVPLSLYDFRVKLGPEKLHSRIDSALKSHTIIYFSTDETIFFEPFFSNELQLLQKKFTILFSMKSINQRILEQFFERHNYEGE